MGKARVLKSINNIMVGVSERCQPWGPRGIVDHCHPRHSHSIHCVEYQMWIKLISIVSARYWLGLDGCLSPRGFTTLKDQTN